MATKKNLDDYSVTLDDEKKELFLSLTPMQKKMIYYTITGNCKPSEAHRLAGGKCKNEKNRRKLASEILTKPDVSKLLGLLQVEVLNEKIMDREEILESLSLIARTSLKDVINLETKELIPPSDKNYDDDAASCIHKIKVTTDGDYITTTTEMTPRLAAIQMLIKMQGLDAPTEINHTVINTADENDW